MEILYFLGAGAVAGICAGLFGIGGGLIIVPILVWVFASMGMQPDVIAHVALGTSLATIVITSISSMMAHNKVGNVVWSVFVLMSAGLVVGSFLGAFVAGLLKSDTLQIIIGIGALAMATKMLFFPNKEQQKPLPKKPIITAAGGAIGFLSAIFGIGGGSLTVPFLNYCGLPMQKAVGTSAACGLPIAIAGAAGFVIFGQGVDTGVVGVVGFVHVWAFVGISVASAVFAKVGARWAHKLPAQKLKRAFGVLLLLVGANLIYAAIGG